MVGGDNDKRTTNQSVKKRDTNKYSFRKILVIKKKWYKDGLFSDVK